MITAELFLGIAVEGAFAKALERVDPQKIDVYVQGGEAYLKLADHQGIKFLGKAAGEHGDVDVLALLEGNIYSLLKKLVPDHSYETSQLQLFAVTSIL